MNKIYFILDKGKPVYVFLDKDEAHDFAIQVWGSYEQNPNISINAAYYELV